MDILVSINCITYNHEKVIANAIEGFLMQKTNFKYEILIGEDCSTDKTRVVIEEYIRKFPSKIRMITSEGNIGFMENIKRLYQNSKGRYIAVCEGDDYWIDPLKLQKQVGYMEAHKECTFCFHNAEKVDAMGKRTNIVMLSNKKNKKIFNAGEMALFGFIPTASHIYRKECLQNPPEWYMKSSVGDLPLLLIATSKGYAYYFDEVMSHYRTGQINSEAGKLLRSSKLEAISFTNGVIDIFNNFNKYTNNIYKKDIDKLIINNEFHILMLENNISKLKTIKYKKLYDLIGFKGKLKIHIRCCFPLTYSGLKKFKSYIMNVIRKIK